MKIEIVEFYPFKNQKPSIIRGTFHIKIIDLGFELRGIYGQWNYKKNKVFFGFPWCGYTDRMTGRFCKVFPYLNIFDEKLRSDVFAVLYSQGKEFMKKNLRG